jgi:CBS domain-containing protein/formate hydrogenlyase subunit 6/NADH:ubiquinone oxidoreductase subunit I
MPLPKLREIKEALTSFFTAPYTTPYPGGPAAVFPSYRGLPKYDKDQCVGCGTCAQVCPSLAIQVADDPAARTRRLRVDYGSCIQCGQCQEKCITGKGIVNTGAYSLALTDVAAPEAFESVEKDLVVCECCGAVIACRDHLLWIKERLGAKAYGHPNLLLATQRLLVGVEPSEPKSRLRREDQIKDACARCRQTIVTLDEFTDMGTKEIPKEARKMTNVRDILEEKGHEVWTIASDATVFEALRTLEKKNVGALVVAEAGQPVGIFSERDYARKVVLKNISSPTTLVREVTTSPIYCVKPETTTEECMVLMTEKRIRHLPVVSEGKLAGLVSIGDIVKALIGEQKVLIEKLNDYIMGRYL